MITVMSDMPDPVVGVEASGKLRAEDYRDVLLPAIEEAASRGDVRIVLVVKDFDGLTGGALWEDLKMGIEHLTTWRRIALTDVEWMRHMASMFGWMTPGQMKHFPLSGLSEAIDWAGA
jgi:hypothetical protein